MDALILAAQRPTSLMELGGRPLIDHQLEALRWAGIEHAVVVAGHRIDDVCNALPAGTTVVENPHYAETGSLYSLWLARQEVGEEVLVLDADVLFHPVIARALLRRPRSAVAYDSRSGRDPEHMKVIVRGGGLAALSRAVAPERSCGESIGMTRLSGPATAAAFEMAGRLVADGRERDAFACGIARVAREHRVECLDVAGLPWVEIDTPEDLDYARRCVASHTLARAA